MRWRYRVTDRRLEAAIRMTEDRMAAPLKIRRLAELTGVSERQLERLFEASFGKSPSEFYMDLRLKAARAKLLGSTDSLEQIAEALGFSSQAHFSRAIKAWCGASPLSIRRRRGPVDVGSVQENDGDK